VLAHAPVFVGLILTLTRIPHACACARHVQPDVSSDEEDSDNGEECDEEEPERDVALLTDEKLLDLFLKKQKRLDQEATNPGLTSTANGLARAVKGAGGDKGPVTPPPRPTPALQSMITPRGGVESREDTKTNPQLSVQARALLSPRLPEVCWNVLVCLYQLEFLLHFLLVSMPTYSHSRGRGGATYTHSGPRGGGAHSTSRHPRFATKKCSARLHNLTSSEVWVVCYLTKLVFLVIRICKTRQQCSQCR
jgi:hypothetical protein